MMFDELATMVNSIDVDKKNIGRWVCVKLVVKDGHTNRVITVYHPIQVGKNSVHSVYSQQRIYYKQRGEKERPRKLFRRYLVNKMN